MTKERKAEVNRRLAEFEFPDTPEGRLVRLEVKTKVHRWGCDCARCKTLDYTADLNALVRLEAKLPMHGWVMNYFERGGAAGTAFVTLHDNNGERWGETVQATEAEARAEAISQYLESLE